MSRKARPKPFLPLIGDTTLFGQAIARVTGDPRFAEPIIVAGAEHCDLIEEQMQQAPSYRLIVEPAARNTAPAIALAAARLAPDAIMLVCPSDHHIADSDAFRAAALAAADLAGRDWFVSFGIAAERPETGYGYLHRGDPLPGGGVRIARFVEKPDLKTAKQYLQSGQYSWNGGIFAFRAGALLAELAIHRPAMAQAVAKASAAGRSHGPRFHPQAEAFARIKGESIDYALMENTQRAAMVPVDMGWSDIGNWAALHDALNYALNGVSHDTLPDGLPDGLPAELVEDRTGELADTAEARDHSAGARGNITRGRADLDETCRNVLAISDGPRISAVGLEDVCIVVSGGEVLVTTREGAQRVGTLPGVDKP